MISTIIVCVPFVFGLTVWLRNRWIKRHLISLNDNDGLLHGHENGGILMDDEHHDDDNNTHHNDNRDIAANIASIRVQQSRSTVGSRTVSNGTTHSTTSTTNLPPLHLPLPSSSYHLISSIRDIDDDHKRKGV
jgi:hypothetical protein